MLGQGQVAGADSRGVIYDLSSFDPLQAHALQLTASAGLTNLLAHPPGVAGAVHNGEGSTTLSMHGQHAQPNQSAVHVVGAPPPGSVATIGHAPTQAAVAHQPTAYYYIQPQNGAPGSLQPIAPSPHQAVATALAPQAAQPASFLLPAGTPATLAGVPAAYRQQILPSTTAAGAPQTVLPGISMSQHLQTVVANAAHHPPPLAPAIAPSRKREGIDKASTDQRKTKKQREIAPSVISASTNTTGYSGIFGISNMDKPPQEASQKDLDKMTPAERRRYERNLREQQRSYKISQQIKELRDVLSESNVPFKPNKYSILLSVVDYIKQLQSRAIMLDAEHRKLITTIRQTNEMVNSGNSVASADETTQSSTSPSAKDSELLFVQGLDYRSVFDQCPAALGIAALDGRILECNPEFQVLLGLPPDQLLKQSLFNLVRNHQDIFRAMAEMLKGAEVSGSCDTTSVVAKNRFWSGAVISKQDYKVRDYRLKNA